MHNSFLLSTFFFFPQMLPNALGVEAAIGEWEHRRLRGGKEQLCCKLASYALKQPVPLASRSWESHKGGCDKI